MEKFFALYKPRITEITEVSTPGIDATVIVDVFDPHLTKRRTVVQTIVSTI